MPFEAFWTKYEDKFFDENLEHKADAINMLIGEKVFDEIADDIKEPDAVNKVLDHEFTTWNMLSQNARTLTKYNKKDQLHCVVSGFGEQFTLVSPYQRSGVQAGVPSVSKGEDGKEEEVICPADHSHMNILDAHRPKTP